MNAALRRLCCCLAGSGLFALSLSTAAAFPHSGLVSVSAGFNNTCVVMADHHVSCWGQAFGAVPTPTPKDVPGITSATAVATGSNFACAILVDQSVACWGTNNRGQLGDGTQISRNTPAAVLAAPPRRHPFTNIIAITAGDSYACALRDDHTVFCWGSNSTGQIGNANVGVGGNSLYPIDAGIDDPATGTVTELTNVMRVSAGSFHVCATFGGDQTMTCWGEKSYGRLGEGDVVTTMNTPVNSPITVRAGDGTPLAGTAAGIIVAGDGHSCSVLPENAPYLNSVACWGDNNSGELGNPYEFGYATSVPAPVVFDDGSTKLTDVSAVVAGAGFTCATLIADSTVACWGVNDSGQLGNVTETAGHSVSPIPVKIAGMATITFSEIAAGSDHACGIHGSLVLCWGSNRLGQLGIGSTDSAAHASPQNAGVDPPIFADNLDGN